MRAPWIPLVLFPALLSAFQAEPATVLSKLGHSSHGEVFDSGPRQKPWKMSGLGQAHFPITTKNPEVQMWFDQGNALLHSFWDYEAERAFRWVLKLEPDNAMAYWGLARASMLRGLGGKGRPAEMIREALKRKGKASEREQLYIDALAAQLLPNPLKGSDGVDTSREERMRQALNILETLCVRYPDDMEARALLALQTMGDSRYGAELMIREILARQPDHPGAHHYRIHNWDYHEPEQALESAQRYGSIAPDSAHALHMPGHIFSIVGMWNEAAIAMDSATRREKQYMQERLTFPFNNWNYGHNRYYLSYIQEQLGMANAAIFGARQLLDAPHDPQSNSVSPFSSQTFGILALARALLKFERWDEILKENSIPWRDITTDKAARAYTEARAHFGKGNQEAAEKQVAAHAALKGELEKEKGTRNLGFFPSVYKVQGLELRGRLALGRKETLEGLSLLAEAAKLEAADQRDYADPPANPEVPYNALGEAYLNNGSPRLAVEAYEKALALTRNDLFALSGMVRAQVAAGNRAKAQEAMARLRYVAAGADKDLPVIARAMATGITAEPRDRSPGPQRVYSTAALGEYGPERWEPYAAPKLDAVDSAGKRATLEEYRGKNVILVFYLGHGCPHCVRQLHDIAGKKSEWERLDTAVVALSSASPEKNAESLKTPGELPVRLLSDDRHQNARRFLSYDDFEEMEIHSTILIDKKGRVHWARSGGEPFTDMAFVVRQLERMNEAVKAR
jgi:peroxiredoxin/tetratricopeptide (TPR) repeat protein